MVSLQSTIFKDMKVLSHEEGVTGANEEHGIQPAATQALCHKHTWWDCGKGWKNIWNNLRLIIQPYVYYCLL